MTLLADELPPQPLCRPPSVDVKATPALEAWWSVEAAQLLPDEPPTPGRPWTLRGGPSKTALPELPDLGSPSEERDSKEQHAPDDANPWWPCTRAAEDNLEPPQAPEALSVESAGVLTRCALRWQPPVSEGSMPITHYIIMVRELNRACSEGDAPEMSSAATFANDGQGADGTSSEASEERVSNHLEVAEVEEDRKEWEVSTDSSLLHYTVTGLSAGETYEFQLRAVSAAGESPPSEASRFCSGPRLPGPPGQPWTYGPLADPPYDPVLAFAAPRETGGAPVQGYRCITFARGHPELTMEVPLLVMGCDHDVITAAAIGFDGNRECQFAVQARNAGGWGPLGPSSAPIFVWRPGPPGRPRAAVAETAPGSPAGLKLAWEAARDQTGKRITTYMVHIHEYMLQSAGGEFAGWEPRRAEACLGSCEGPDREADHNIHGSHPRVHAAVRWWRVCRHTAAARLCSFPFWSHQSRCRGTDDGFCRYRWLAMRTGVLLSGASNRGRRAATNVRHERGGFAAC
eukprot:gnl/TRDRNA2_/TRDRNA2_167918_c1_seq1.p1 gnl/TRDRNA2_/TRDRNA2_167918_c1~~gnl/TRDRNA2_/TRDRNA2_167918_c1_seq1.p1  ORF type:complete len:516 (-),score=53.53 gnl/TRDRNA2_/TRDRNA2_167918_c1_seq1:24-1571(-)